MKENKPVTYHIQISSGMLEYLKPESGSKYSRMAAFRDLLERAVSAEKRSPSSCAPLLYGQAAVTVNGLSKQWNWHRTTVSRFLSVLEQQGAAQSRQRGGFIIVTMTCLSPDNGEEKAKLFSEEEQRMNRWLCGYLAMEELAETIVHFITETDRIFGAGPTGRHTDRQLSVGQRLHSLIAHIILRHTDLIPADEKVNEALAKLFTEECGKDLARFLQRLTMAGLQLIGNDAPRETISACSGNECTDIILRHYLPFIGGRTRIHGPDPFRKDEVSRENRN